MDYGSAALQNPMAALQARIRQGTLTGNLQGNQDSGLYRDYFSSLLDRRNQGRLAAVEERKATVAERQVGASEKLTDAQIGDIAFMQGYRDRTLDSENTYRQGMVGIGVEQNRIADTYNTGRLGVEGRNAATNELNATNLGLYQRGQLDVEGQKISALNEQNKINAFSSLGRGIGELGFGLSREIREWRKPQAIETTPTAQNAPEFITPATAQDWLRQNSLQPALRNDYYFGQPDTKDAGYLNANPWYRFAEQIFNAPTDIKFDYSGGGFTMPVDLMPVPFGGDASIFPFFSYIGVLTDPWSTGGYSTDFGNPIEFNF